MTATPHQILVRARTMIADPDRWTQRTFARTSTGDECDSGSPEAHAFCAFGAVNRAGDDLKACTSTIAETRRALARQCQTEFGRTVAGLNDFDTHAQVLSLFDSTIETTR